MPGWDYEEQCWGRGGRRVAGCDEAGRGPLAGPVVAAAVILPRGLELAGLNDSKKLDAGKRTALYPLIRAGAEAVGVGIAWTDEIDTLNILQASFLAMRRALAALGEPADHVLVDGHQRIPGLRCAQQPVVGGDGHSMSIAAASIIAKVTRDELMIRFDRLHPGYGFAGHKGYSCPQHDAALAQLGPCVLHRRSFAPVRALLDDPPPLPPARCRGTAPAQLTLFGEDEGGPGSAT